MANLTSTVLRDLQDRGFIHQCTDLRRLDTVLAEKCVAVYAGFDCTASSLHVGNMMTLMLLRRLRQHGHDILPLVGGATTMIGDPTGKDHQRPLLSSEQIEANMLGIRDSIHRVLFGADGTGKSEAHRIIEEAEVTGRAFRRRGAESALWSSMIERREARMPGDAVGEVSPLLNNYDWMEQRTVLDWLRDIGPLVSVNRMLHLDSVTARLDKQEHMTFLEFNYAVFQAFDFLMLHVDHDVALQVGGSDQWGNIIMGVELIQRKVGNDAPAFGLTHPLLTTPDGRKMGKTEAGTAVWLNPDMLPDWDFWQYWRNVPDAMVGKLLKMFTDLPVAVVDDLMTRVALGEADINSAKDILATQVTALVRGTEAAERSREAAAKVFSGGLSADMPTVVVNSDQTIVEACVLAGLAESKSAARRLIEQGGIRVDGEVVTDQNLKLGALLEKGELCLSKGKRQRVRVTRES
jgi:tyrosyl-tRNA synthetase